jgi:hypothetical protein
LLAVEPARVEVVPKAQVVFRVAGVDQYGQAYPLGGIEWTAQGCMIDSSGQMTTAETPGIYRVTARAAGLQADAEVIVALRATEPTPAGGKVRLIRWSGAVPPQKWMNFYTKVLARFIGSPGLALTVTFEVQADADEAKRRVEEAKPTFRRSRPRFPASLLDVRSGVHELLGGDPDERQELALEGGQFRVEPLDDAIVFAEQVTAEGREELQDPVGRGGPAGPILGVER